MSLLKVLPVLIVIGAATAAAAGAVASLFEEEEIRHDENTKKEVLKKMKDVQNELARFSDLKILNDKRESTSQVKSVDLMIGDVEINELIAKLEEELARLTKKYNKFDTPKKRK